MSVLIWFTAMVCGISGSTALVVGQVEGNWTKVIAGMLALLGAVLQARVGVARMLNLVATAVEEGERL